MLLVDLLEIGLVGARRLAMFQHEIETDFPRDGFEKSWKMRISRAAWVAAVPTSLIFAFIFADDSDFFA